MLLPHGFEGQGPEHSSARLERFLGLCAEDNIQVVNLTTPGQLFHCLRRQVLRPLRKPLIVMTPKSLLRHPQVVSSLDDLATGRFHAVLPDLVVPDPMAVRRVLLCSGKIYYDLEAARLASHPFSGITRNESASPATGSAASHKMEQELLIEKAFEIA
jgi:2-oxoglutarate dehydrogenase E1 component